MWHIVGVPEVVIIISLEKLTKKMVKLKFEAAGPWQNTVNFFFKVKLMSLIKCLPKLLMWVFK